MSDKHETTVVEEPRETRLDEPTAELDATSEHVLIAEELIDLVEGFDIRSLGNEWEVGKLQSVLETKAGELGAQWKVLELREAEAEGDLPRTIGILSSLAVDRHYRLQPGETHPLDRIVELLPRIEDEEVKAELLRNMRNRITDAIGDYGTYLRSYTPERVWAIMQHQPETSDPDRYLTWESILETSLEREIGIEGRRSDSDDRTADQIVDHILANRPWASNLRDRLVRGGR